MKKLLIVDGNSILNRAFYGVRPLTTRDGRNTNAIFGFINMLYKQISELSPDYAAIAFDLKKPTFRHEKCDYYKANRKGMPEELLEQLEPAKKISTLMGFHLLTKEGYEADDILGTLSVLSDKDTRAYIMTGDRDSYQLITDTSLVLYVSTKETSIFDAERVKENYGGLSPEKLIDVKALMGDTSDNIPGVPGIGEKTAVNLIADFGSLDGVYAALESGDARIKGAVKTKLENGKGSAYESRFLAEICKSVPLGLSLSDLEYKGLDKKGLFDICSDFELNSIITRLGLTPAKESTPLFSGSLFETESTKLEATECKNIPHFDKDTVFVYADTENDVLYLTESPDKQIYYLDATKDSLSELFENKAIKTVVHGLKEMCIYCAKFGVKVENCSFDTLLGSYVINPAKVLTVDNLYSYTNSFGVDINDKTQKSILCVKSIAKAYGDFYEKIKETETEKLLYEIEMPCSFVLAQMELTGFKLNCDKLRDFSIKLDKRIEHRKNNIYALAGCEFNINSTKQLAEVLFEKLELPTQKKNKSGYSTDAETLEKLRPYHPIIDEILEYRLVAKLKSTYTDALISAADKDGRIHTVFKQAFTHTGRLSSAEPNLQNIPIKTEEGRELRSFFEAKDENYVLIDADYSQIELRLMAIVSEDENMINTYRQGKDIHTSTASQVFGVPEEYVTPDMRKKAKAVNFGIIYGIGEFSLAADIHVTRKQAGEYIKSYFENFPKVKEYLDASVAFAKENGYSKTLFGRRRYIPELAGKNKNLIAFGERVAMNAPIQGTAADIIKIAMVNVAKRLEKECTDSRLVLQVHDELIVEANKNEKDIAEKILREEMENAANLPVNLEVEVKVSDCWTH